MSNVVKKISSLIFITTILISSPATIYAASSTPGNTHADDREVAVDAQIPPVKEDVKSNGVIVAIDAEIAQEYAADKIDKFLGKDIRVEETIEDMSLSLYLVKDTVENRSVQDFVDVLQKNEIVRYAEPNYISPMAPPFVPNDPYTEFSQWNLDQASLPNSVNSDTDLDAFSAWDIERPDSEETIVAFIDTGINYTLPDIAPNMWDGSTGCKDHEGQEISGGCPSHGWDYRDDDNDPTDAGPYRGHGTSAASIIGAVTNNDTDIAGISRYNKAKIMSLRVGYVDANDIFSNIKAINFAKNNGAKVIVAEYLQNYHSVYELDAIMSFEGVVVAAAGNGARNNDTDPIFPCNYDAKNVICVAALEKDGELAHYSSYGKESVDIAAPTFVESLSVNGGLRSFNGTSAAIPHVGGVATMLYSEDPTLSPETVIEIMEDNATQIPALAQKVATGGTLNFAQSLAALQSGSYTEPEEEEVNCVDEGNDDAWGVNLNDKNYGGCWIDGIVDETLCSR